MKAAGFFGLFFLVMSVAACGGPPQPTPPSAPTPTLVVPLGPTATAAAPPPTPAPSLTPTPTAAPLYVYDGLRIQRHVEPASQRGAPCGVVDFFDFPLGAPEGEGAVARWPFGRYSERYSGIHAGEDWVYDGGDSLGKPVYSIGHGTVIYAQPLGWGIDQGTLIVRHVFTDGRTILSFYGHLQPESVVLNPGDCVVRGDVVGRIGKPRGRPHLHFEIRTIFPDQPGPGYWSVDPRRAGWQPPTEYIWDQRIATSPGVKWTRPFTTSSSLLIGLLLSNTLAAVDHNQLLALDAESGHVIWSRPLAAPDTAAAVRQAIVDDTRATIYLTTISHTLQAISMAGEVRWQVPFSATTRSVLLPHPGGGLIAHDGSALVGLSPQGHPLWRFENLPPPIDWVRDGENLIFSTGDKRPAVYRLTPAGQITLITPLTGRLMVEPDHLLVYGGTALYRLSEEPHIVKELDRVVYGEGQVIAAPAGALKGGLILAHHGVNGRRLIALRPDGALRWERSIQRITGSAPQLVVIDDEVYALTEEGDVWWIDQRTGEAQRVLDGTRWLTLSGEVRSVVTAEGTLIFDARGGRLVALNPAQAIMAEPADDWSPR